MICSERPRSWKAEHVVADDFLLEADAARALNAAFPIQVDQVAQRHMLVEVLLVFDSTCGSRRGHSPSSGSAAGTRRPCRKSGSRAGGWSAGIRARSGAHRSPPASVRLDDQTIADGRSAGRLQLGLPADWRLRHRRRAPNRPLSLSTARAAQLDQAHAAHADRAPSWGDSRRPGCRSRSTWRHRRDWCQRAPRIPARQ